MIYDLDSFTYGVELEYGNAYRFNPLPAGASWNSQDDSCVSSTGIANDPKGELYKFGGEINTRPTYTVSAQAEHIDLINRSLDPKPIVNYRSNLHIHVRVPGLSDNLMDCKKLLQYIVTHQEAVFDLVEPIPKPSKSIGPLCVYDGAMERYKRRLRSHHYKLPPSRVKAMMNATTVEEFHQEHAPLTPKGRMWYFSPRAGINLRQMWDASNTIEFRHFPGTLDVFELLTCMDWCKHFLHAALNTGEDPVVLFNKHFRASQFPKFPDYNYETEQVYKYTNLAHNKRAVVAERLARLRRYINIDRAESLKVYGVMRAIQRINL